MNRKNIIRRIPGDILPPSKEEGQGYIDDLAKKSKSQLEELLERQNKILANKHFISKLPDKGKRLVSFRDKISKELAHKNEMEAVANLFSQLNIASQGKKAMSELEWTGKYSTNDKTANKVELDSDDEEDPLRILAQPTGSGTHKKKIIQLAPEESLIKPADLVEIESFKVDRIDTDHVKYIVDKVEKAQEANKRESFKAYKTTKSKVHDPMKEKHRKKRKNWEVTAATPPLIVHGAAKVLSLDESLRLQKEQTERLQETQMRRTLERLVDQVGQHGIGPLPQTVGSYRSQHYESDSSSSDAETVEIHNEEDNDKGGTVVFTVDFVES